MREGFAPAGPRHRRARADPAGPMRGLARRGLGAVGNSRIVAYGARSPARSAAEGHARTAVPSAECPVPILERWGIRTLGEFARLKQRNPNLVVGVAGCMARS